MVEYYIHARISVLTVIGFFFWFDNYKQKYKNDKASLSSFIKKISRLYCFEWNCYFLLCSAYWSSIFYF